MTRSAANITRQQSPPELHHRLPGPQQPYPGWHTVEPSAGCSTVTLNIPSGLFERVSDLVAGRGSAGVTDFVIDILREHVPWGEFEKGTAKYSAFESTLIRERLIDMDWVA